MKNCPSLIAYICLLFFSGTNSFANEVSAVDTKNAESAKAADAQQEKSRSSYPDYRLVSSLHGLTAEQVEKINKVFDEQLAKHRSGLPVDQARMQYYAAVKTFLNPAQLKELAAFRDPLAESANIQVEHDLAYVPNGDAAQVGDLYLPKNAKGAVPAVLFIHGGGWSGGSKEQSTFTAIQLAKHGFAVFNINYRLVGHGGEFPADVIDVKDAFAFMASKASEWKIDPAKIAVMGGSAGAHLSMLLGYSSNKQFPAEHYQKSSAKPAAVVSWFGPVDLSVDHQMIKDYLAKAGKEGSHDASPINYADTAIPTLFVHGTKDLLVPIANSETMHKALQQRKIPSELEVIEGAEHGFKGEQWERAVKKTNEFLDQRFAN